MAEDFSDEGWQERWDKHRVADAPRTPSSWPRSVRPISLGGLLFLGIDNQTGHLFWNGRQVETRTVLRLEGWTFAFVAMTGVGTLGLFLLEFAKALGWFGLH